MGGLFAAPNERARTIVRTITADATAKNQRLATARSYRGYLASFLVISIGPGRSGSAGRRTTIFNG